MSKRIDIHYHVLGTDHDWEAAERGEALYYYTDDNNPILTKILAESTVRKAVADYGKKQFGINGEMNTDSYWNITLKNLSTSSQIDAITLLALDASYDSKGNDTDNDSDDDYARGAKKTDLWVPNRYLWPKIDQANKEFSRENSSKRLLFGGSVNPHLRNWKNELEFLIGDTEAVLLKFIPSVQNVNLSEVPPEYWSMVRDAGLPILVHVGPEYGFPEGLRRHHLDVAKKLEAPLIQGVTVIAAHCGAPIIPFDRSYVEELEKLMRRFNKNSTVLLWTDTSALTMSERFLFPTLPEIRKHIPAELMLHGSDFPVPLCEFDKVPPYLPDKIDASVMNDIKTTTHWLDHDVKIKLALSFQKDTLTRARQILRLKGNTKEWFESE